MYAGPNTRTRAADGPWVADDRGAIADFSAGVVSGPSDDANLWRVLFFLGSADRAATPVRTYTVVYAMDPETDQGLMFFPHGNSVVYHGIEGQWLRASVQWETLVRPQLEAAIDAAR